MKHRMLTVLAVVSLALTPIAVASAAPATTSTVTYQGQGLIADGFGSYDLLDEICGVANGADVDGPYLLWVFTATKAKSATITGPWGTSPMVQMGTGTFKYISAWYDPDTLIAAVSATSDTASTNPQLVISHGCRPYDKGAWCSPGFWRNAESQAWVLTGHTRNDLFNTTVPFYWFGKVYAVDPTLGDVLNNPGIYAGAPFPGTSGYMLNAFNATGAMLTDSLVGYTYSWDAMVQGNDDACPIDHHGNLK